MDEHKLKINSLSYGSKMLYAIYMKKELKDERMDLPYV